MNKEQFLKELEEFLLTLPADERKSAIKYYDEYFEEAGEENEQAIITELGSPRKIADGILKESNTKLEANNSQESNNTKNYNSNKQNNIGIWIVLIIVGIFFLPVIFPILITILCVCFALLVSGIAIFFGGLVTSIMGITMIFTSPAIGILTSGVGLILVGTGIILSIAIFNVLVKAFPAMIRGIVNLIQRVFNTGGVR